MIPQYELIFINLYRFRFLQRHHIQSFLHHKQFNRIIVWLNYLTYEHYIRRYYNPNTPTVGAIYSLGVKGRQYLKEQKIKGIKIELLDRVWGDPRLSPQFRKHCAFVADIYLSLGKLVQKTEAKLFFKTQTDLYGMKYLIFPIPDAFFSITEKNGSKRGYFLDIFDEWPSRTELRLRVRRYFDYYQKNYWQDHSPDPFPNIILIAPDDSSKNFIYRQIQRKLEDEPEIRFYLSTWEQIKTVGLTRETLQNVELPD